MADGKREKRPIEMSGISTRSNQRKSTEAIEVDEKRAKLNRLRVERQNRERKEAERANRLIQGTPCSSVRSQTDERHIDYHQQFNPHLVRRH